jgi:hypothetical protein
MDSTTRQRPFFPSRARRSVRAFRLDHSVGVLTVIMTMILGGYLLFNRAFAWLHVPGTPIFVGEVVLVFGLYVIIQTPHLGRLLRVSRSVQLLLLFMAWGFASSFDGLSSSGVVDTLRDSALWYYGAFALIASVLLLYKPELWDDMVDRLTRYIPVFLGIIAVRLAFANVETALRIPDSNVKITAHKTGDIAVNVAIALALLIIVVGPSASDQVRKRATTHTLLGLLIIVAAGTQNRGGFVAAFVILSVVFVIARHARAAMLGVLGFSLLLAILAAALDVRLQLDRRELSVEQIIDNVQSVTEETSAIGEANTTQWRLSFWTIVLDDIGEDRRWVAGYGFGENLALRFGFENPDQSVPLRNPHNSHLSVLARMGLVGFGLWIALFGTWYSGLIRARRHFLELGEDRRAALALWLLLAMTALLVNAFFDPTIEGPQVGILLWTLFGMGAALGLGARSVSGRRRRRSRARDAFDWVLIEAGQPVSARHPVHEGLVLSDDLREVLTGFDDLLAEDEDDG